MILFSTLFAAAGSAGTAAAGTAAVAGSGAAAAGGFGSIGTWIGLASTAVGALAEIGAGNAQAAALESQALWDDFRAKQEVIDGRFEAAKELRNLNDTVAQQIVSGYASGLQGSGSVEQSQRDAIELGQLNVDLARDNSAIRAGARRGQAEQSRAEASAARSGGVFGALKHGFNFFTRKYGRG